MPSHLWMEETHEGVLGMRYKVENVLFSGKSPYQSIDIVETKGHGKMLWHDGIVMISERDEFVYHEMISHVPLFVHPRPERVLIIGGGDGGTAREVCRHDGVQTCTMVEIDKMVVDTCRKWIPSCGQGTLHPKVRLIFADGAKFVQEHKGEGFDVILVDSSDPIGPATVLFESPFYQNINSCLREGGIVVSQGEDPWYETSAQKNLLKILRDIFPLVSIYNFHNLTYPGGLWSFSFASHGLHPLRDFNLDRVSKSSLKFKYYTKDIHKSAFSLPRFMQDDIGDLLRDK